MRVGSEAVGGTPFDAAGPKGADTMPGEPGGAGAGFFALLALLQAGAAPAEGGALVTDGVPPDDPSAAEGEADAGAAGEAGSSVGGDVVVTLSSAAVVGVAAVVASPAGTAAPAPPDAPAGGDDPISSGGPVSEAAIGAGGAELDRQPAVVVPAATEVGAAKTARAHSARATHAARASGAQRAPEMPEGAAGESRGVPVVQASKATRSQVPVPVPERIAIASAAEGPFAPAVDSVRAVRRATDAQAMVTSALGHDAAQGAAPGEPPMSHDGAEHRDGARDTVAAPPPAPDTSAERSVASASLEPPSTTTPSETPERNADLAPPVRDTSKAAEGASGPAAGAQRAALADGTSMPGWIERLTSAQRLASARRSNALLFDLEPAGLGRIEVRLSFGRDGVRAQVFTEHDHTRALIASQQPQLAAAFERNDVRLASFLVDLGLGGEGSGEARREASEAAAFDLGLAGGVRAARAEEAPASTPILTGLLSVRA